MTKQEEIRKGMAKYFWGLEASYPWPKNPKEGTEAWYAQRTFYTKADTVLAYLHSQGLVIKVDRKLPVLDISQFDYTKGIELDALKDGFYLAADKYKKAGYVAVEPLRFVSIKEVKHASGE